MNDVWFFTVAFMIIMASLVQSYKPNNMETESEENFNPQRKELNHDEEKVGYETEDTTLKEIDRKDVKEQVIKKEKTPQHKIKSRLRNMILSNEILRKKYKF